MMKNNNGKTKCTKKYVNDMEKNWIEYTELAWFVKVTKIWQKKACDGQWHEKCTVFEANPNHFVLFWFGCRWKF